jgi:hypothetical protein
MGLVPGKTVVALTSFSGGYGKAWGASVICKETKRFSVWSDTVFSAKNWVEEPAFLQQEL